MAYTYRSNSSQGNGSGGALTVSKPAGTADGDLIVVVGYLESDTNTWTSVGSGFTEVKNIDNTGLFDLRMWYKWASGEPASWTWTPNTSAWRTVVVASYSGGSGSGSQPDVSSSAQGDAQLVANQTAPSVTTTANDDLLTYGYGNFTGTNMTTASGAATNVRISFGGATITDANIATPSATGTTAPNAGPGTEDYAAVHVALFLSPGGVQDKRSVMMIVNPPQPFAHLEV
jgi:hypothetical protein